MIQITNAVQLSGVVRSVGELIVTLSAADEADLVASGRAVYVGPSSLDPNPGPQIGRHKALTLMAGDSLVNQGWAQTGAPNNFVAVNTEGAYEWANALAGARLHIIGNLASGGKTAAQVMTEQMPSILRVRPGAVLYSMGHNDIYNDLVSGRVAANRILDVVKASLDADIIPIWSTVWAREYSASYLAAHLDCNDRLRIWAQDNPSSGFWDGFAASVDPASTTCEGLSTWYYTPQSPLIHINNLGAYWLGKKLATVISALFPARPSFAAGAEDATNTGNTSNVLTNPHFTGTGGTKDGTTVVGTVPTGWKVDWVTRTGSGVATAAIVNVADPDTGLTCAKAIEVTITSGTVASGDEVRITQDSGFNTRLSGRDITLSEAQVQLVTPTAVDRIRTLLLVNNNEQTNWGNAVQTQAALPEAMRLSLRSRPMAVLGSGAAAAARFDVRMRFNGNGAGSVLRMWQPRVRKGYPA